jgi:hypothetical protein
MWVGRFVTDSDAQTITLIIYNVKQFSMLILKTGAVTIIVWWCGTIIGRPKARTYYRLEICNIPLNSNRYSHNKVKVDVNAVEEVLSKV